MQQRTVGMFGTCGASTWRKPFMEAFDALGVPFFNPQVLNWSPELAEVEAKHLSDDPIILFPITNETLAVASLTETGYAVANASVNSDRYVIVLVAQDVSEDLVEQSPQAAADSMRARKLVLAHLARIDHPRIMLVSSLEAMLAATLKVYAARELLRASRAGEPVAPAGFSAAFWQQLQYGPR